MATGASASLSTLSRDLRWAFRTLRRTPGVTLAAMLALALGIGANTAIFSVVDGVLLRPLPFPESHEVYRVHRGAGAQFTFGELSYPQYQDVVAGTPSLESIGGWVDGDVNLSGGNAPERVLMRLVLPSLLPTLKVQPIRGRNFLPDETREGRNRVVLIAHRLWQRQFAGQESALGRSIRLDGQDFTVVGILPPGFQFEGAVDIWMPLGTDDPGLRVRNSHFLEVVGRLRPGASIAQLNSELSGIARLWSDRYPDMFPPSHGLTFHARPYLESVVGDVRLPLLILLGAVAFVLIMTCANVANLLLARAAAREREMAIRTALGAGRGRLVRQMLTESLLLALGGGLLGVLFASLGVDALIALSPDSLPRVTEVKLDLRVLLFTGAVAIGTGIAFGLVPAIAESRPRLNRALKDGMFGTSSRGRLRKALVIGEVAISLVLLLGAGLMLRSFVRLSDVDPGFRADHGLMVRASLPVPAGPLTEQDRDRFVDFFSRVPARLRQLPGVTAAGACNAVPLGGSGGNRLIEIVGYVRRDSADMPSAEHRQATPGFFEAMGIPLLEGRSIGPQDDAGAPGVVVVNQTFARRFFPGGRAIGRQIRLGKLTQEFPWATIVGIIGDVRGRGLHIPPRPEMYWPVAQIRSTPTMSIVVRTEGDPAALAGSVRAAIADVAPGQPLYGLQTLEELVATSLGQRRFTLTLMMVFGLVALALAAVGIYGVMAYTVAQRTREIGIRVALGARPARVLRMVVGSGMALVATGAAIGLAASLVVTRVVSSLLYGISATDPATYLIIAGTLAAVALAAMLIPARRAMLVDPMRALRSE